MKNDPYRTLADEDAMAVAEGRGRTIVVAAIVCAAGGFGWLSGRDHACAPVAAPVAAVASVAAPAPTAACVATVHFLRDYGHDVATCPGGVLRLDDSSLGPIVWCTCPKASGAP